jgi:hypothetical protein
MSSTGMSDGAPCQRRTAEQFLWGAGLYSLARELAATIPRHAGRPDEERSAAIAADVEACWHLRAGEAGRLLVGEFVAASVAQNRAA